jgi:hypothetical protein
MISEPESAATKHRQRLVNTISILLRPSKLMLPLGDIHKFTAVIYMDELGLAFLIYY